MTTHAEGNAQNVEAPPSRFTVGEPAGFVAQRQGAPQISRSAAGLALTKEAGRRVRTLRSGSSARERPRTIVHLTAEYYPYARTGGLAEAVAGLASFQTRAGRNVVVFLPLYPSVRTVAPELIPLGPPQRIVIGGRTEEVRFFREAEPRSGPKVIFVDSPAFFARPGLYGTPDADYPDNHLRFALFSLASLHGIAQFVSGPVLLHAHDWHTALAPVYLRTLKPIGARSLSTPTVLSVHNAGYQGHFTTEAMADLGLPWELWNPDHLEWYGKLNLLKGGLTFCDMAVTVSPTHAEELHTPEGGFGLHDTFRDLGPRLAGICNGIDPSVWNPAEDPHIVANYSPLDLSGKALCKDALQASFGLERRPDVPIFAMPSRLVGQKGLDIVLCSERLRSANAQFIFLGTGEPRYHERLTALASEVPGSVAVEFGFTEILEHRLIAGADLVLMPSLYEPCGLTQMHAQRYGVPVVGRRVGGISDTVSEGETGFLFDAYEAAAFDEAVDRAVARFADRPAWQAMVRRAMTRDFGWDRSVRKYADIYRAAEYFASVAA